MQLSNIQHCPRFNRSPLICGYQTVFYVESLLLIRKRWFILLCCYRIQKHLVIFSEEGILAKNLSLKRYLLPYGRKVMHPPPSYHRSRFQITYFFLVSGIVLIFVMFSCDFLLIFEEPSKFWSKFWLDSFVHSFKLLKRISNARLNIFCQNI